MTASSVGHSSAKSKGEETPCVSSQTAAADFDAALCIDLLQIRRDTHSGCGRAPACCERNASHPCIHIDTCMQGGVISEPADCASNVKSIQRDCPPRECLGLFFRRECLVAGSLKNMFGYWWKICLGAYSGPTVGPRKNFPSICLPHKNSGDAISHVKTPGGRLICGPT